MEELPSGNAADRSLTRSSGDAVEPRRHGQLVEFDPVQARRNRRWMALVLFPALLVGAAALIASLLAGSSSPTVHASDQPAGYQSISDGYFGYAVPTTWTQNASYSDDVGDQDYSGQTGWAGEHVDARPNPPAAGEPAPTAFAAFGEPQPRPFTLGPAQPTTVTGATIAFRYQLTRPGGFEATAIDAWISQSGAEIWLLVHTDPATTATILSTLKA